MLQIFPYIRTKNSFSFMYFNMISSEKKSFFCSRKPSLKALEANPGFLVVATFETKYKVVLLLFPARYAIGFFFFLKLLSSPQEQEFLIHKKQSVKGRKETTRTVQ